MTPGWTHYDNLQVSRTASPAVITAAYRALSLRYHPDGSEDQDCERITRIINASYAVLSDPAKRSQHDEWIWRCEQSAIHGGHRPRQSAAPEGALPGTTGRITPHPVLSHLRKFVVVYGLAALITSGIFLADSGPAPSGLPPYDGAAGDKIEPSDATDSSSGTPTVQMPRPDSTSASSSDGALSDRPATIASASDLLAVLADQSEPVNDAPGASISSSTAAYGTAPNGAPWPDVAGYVDGYEQLRSEGLSEVTIDNTRNDSAMFVKLVAIEATATMPVRQVFIPAYGSFTINAITPGSYDVRYKDLASGTAWRSEAFNLVQSEKPTGTRASAVRLTLFTVPNGNSEIYRLQPSEF